MEAPVRTNKLNEKPQTYLEQLELIPVRNEHVKTRKKSEGVLEVEIELNKKGVVPLLRKATGGSEFKIYHLDGYGRFLYERIDGKTFLLEIVYEFMEREALTFFEAKGLLQEYMRILMEKGLVVLVK